jgi:hypothetical protein
MIYISFFVEKKLVVKAYLKLRACLINKTGESSIYVNSGLFFYLKMTDNFIVVEKGITVGCLWFAPLRMK